MSQQTLQLGLRIDEDTISKLRRLEQLTVRSTSDLIRFLIQQEFARQCQHFQVVDHRCIDCGSIIQS